MVLKVTVPEATISYQDDQLCPVLKAVNDGAVHGDKEIWDEKSKMEDWGFLLVYSKNAFNNINRVGLL